MPKEIAGNFTKEDVTAAREFGQYINEYANWNINTKILLKITRMLAWYNKIISKMEGHIFEIEKVIDNRTDEEKKQQEESEKGGK